jgi:hypothetical protein
MPSSTMKRRRLRARARESSPPQARWEPDPGCPMMCPGKAYSLLLIEREP